MMIRAKLMKDLASLRELLEKRKQDGELLYAKIMASMGTKCYHKITKDKAQEVFSSLKTYHSFLLRWYRTRLI